MYQHEKSVTCEDTTARVEDLQHKIKMIDDHFNRKNFSMVVDAHEIKFENFLAKNILKVIRATLQGEINDQHKLINQGICKTDDEV